MAALVFAGGAQQTHVVLSAGMGQRLKQFYGATLHCTPISNIAFLRMAPVGPRSPQLRSIGFMSNLILTKGVDRFLDLADELAYDGISVHIAGPFPSEHMREYVLGRIRSMPHVIYHGPVYGEQKADFLRQVDLFVFLSRYFNEAEPLVLYEAMREGLPIVSTARGCIPDMLDSTMSVLVDKEAASLEKLVSAIRYWRDEPTKFAEMSASASARYSTLMFAGREQYKSFLRLFGR
ncbi:glycosyltransferase family 4 protein [Microvirga aerophila]|uniref:glycosyltransferase family 4 protein n=1 Tax=Microvirga aerophila TaxID=670291 RepID=UPI000DEEE897|nr:glycosyltransferase family 4 protein [Microvirga aerophila]